MLLRSSSTPILNSWLHNSTTGSGSGSSPEPDSLPQLTRTRSVCLITSLDDRIPPTRNVYDSDPKDCGKPKKGKPLKLPATPKPVKAEEIADRKRMTQTLVAGGGGGGGVCGGGRGSDYGSGSQDPGSWHGIESTNAYYEMMIKANPGNPLFLANYAKFLKEVKGDLVKAEEYCGRAILANPSDGNIYVLASYARFLWDAESDDEEEEEDELWFILLFSVPFSDVLVARAFTGTYGINYGRISDNIPPPESVVTLLKAAKIKNIRIYDADNGVLRAFRGSGIEIIIGLPNEFLRDISISQDRAIEWVKENVEPFIPGTLITGIAVGNEILGGGDVELWEVLVPAVRNVYNALDRLRLANHIEVSSPHSEGVFANTFPPSAGAFKESLLPYMRPLLEFFAQIGTPFYINAYPFLAYMSDPSHIDLNYALFRSNPGIYDAKTNLHYDNMFDAQIDASYAALEKVGFGNMDVIVSETGWASRGDESEAGANATNARTYNRNLRKRLLKKKGTPYRPKKPVKAYIFALFNENLKPGPTSERNFGLFKADGSISYDIGFTGLVPSSTSSMKVNSQIFVCVFSAAVVFTTKLTNNSLSENLLYIIYSVLRIHVSI
ncbi:hypothetical protein ACJIZ3_025567 [Penstemon smallii]|uniref:glucan endo-1,3-beta-D-glucosidase n=1 Tax=Penstemon smallii TaxID=265156 RepID=A0ABD3TWN9_9LAMI